MSGQRIGTAASDAPVNAASTGTLIGNSALANPYDIPGSPESVWNENLGIREMDGTVNQRRASGGRSDVTQFNAGVISRTGRAFGPDFAPVGTGASDSGRGDVNQAGEADLADYRPFVIPIIDLGEIRGAMSLLIEKDSASAP